MLSGVAYFLRTPGGVLLVFGSPIGGPKSNTRSGQPIRKEKSFLGIALQIPHSLPPLDHHPNSRQTRTVIDPSVIDAGPNHGHPSKEPDHMPTNQELAVAEFRDASAAVRLAFSARDQAREAQIIANRRYDDACIALQVAQDRLDRADITLSSVKAETKPPADIDASRQPLMNGVAFLDGAEPSGLENENVS